MIPILILGILTMTVPGYIFISRRSMRINGERTNATVVRTEISYSVRNYTVSPVFRFSVDGRTQVAHASYVWHHKRKFKDGETVKIIYDKRNPQKIIIEDDKTTGFFSAIVLLIGFILILSSLSFLL